MCENAVDNMGNKQSSKPKAELAIEHRTWEYTDFVRAQLGRHIDFAGPELSPRELLKQWGFEQCAAKLKSSKKKKKKHTWLELSDKDIESLCTELQIRYKTQRDQLKWKYKAWQEQRQHSLQAKRLAVGAIVSEMRDLITQIQDDEQLLEQKQKQNAETIDQINEKSQWLSSYSIHLEAERSRADRE